MGSAVAPSRPPVSRDELVARLREGALLVDVLPHPSFVEGHIPGAQSLPVADISDNARRVLPDLSRDIIVYCGSFT